MSATVGSTDHLSNNRCSGPRRSFYTFSHDRTIKRFPRIAFPFARGHFPSTFFANFDGTLGLMIPYGFGDPVASFKNPYRQTDPDTPHLTVGHTPWSFGGWSTSSHHAFAFAPRSHRVSTSATHGTRTVEGRQLFLYLFHGRRPRPRPRPRRGGRGGLGLEVRVDVRRTEGRPPPSS